MHASYSPCSNSAVFIWKQDEVHVLPHPQVLFAFVREKRRQRRVVHEDERLGLGVFNESEAFGRTERRDPSCADSWHLRLHVLCFVVFFIDRTRMCVPSTAVDKQRNERSAPGGADASPRRKRRQRALHPPVSSPPHPTALL